MGIAVSTVCRTCDSDAPELGDWGHLGYPSLNDCLYRAEGMASFEHTYRGYTAIGLRFLELDGFRAWLEEHATHNVALFFDDHRIGTRRRYKLPAPSERLGKVDPASYSHCFFELTCEACRARFRTSASYALKRSDKALSADDVKQFRDRVLQTECNSYYRTFGLLNPGSDECRQLNAFLGKHRRHRLRARTVSEEAWTAPGWAPLPAFHAPVDHLEPAGSSKRVPPRVTLPPPLRVEWSHPKAALAPLVVQAGRIFTVGGKRQWLLALDLNGRELWRTDAFEDWALHSLFVRGDRVWMPSYSHSAERGRLFGLDPATGRVAQALECEPSVETFVDDGVFVGRQFHPRNKPIETVGLYRIGSDLETIWEHEVPSVTSRPLCDQCASDGTRLFVNHGADALALDLRSGRELWRASFDPSDNSLPMRQDLLSTEAGIVIHGLRCATHGLDAETGRTRWTTACPVAGIARAVYDDSVVFVGAAYADAATKESHFLRVSLKTGCTEAATDTTMPFWNKTPEPRPVFCSVPRPTDDVVYVGDRDGRLWALCPATGEPVWMLGLPDTSGWLGDIVAARDRLFVRDGSGTLYCLSRSA
jgi:outer membrane protein assembly factor BamB